MDNNYKKTIIKDNLNSNCNLYKLVDNLKNKLAKLEAFCKTNIHQQKNISHIPRSNNNQTILSSYRIFYPKITKNTKKFVGLLFDSNFSDTSGTNDLVDDNNTDINKLSFIKLNKSNNIINYSITLKVNSLLKESNSDTICTFSLGIRELNGNAKVKIIKGSQMQYDIVKNTIDGNIIINNTILFNSVDNQELCLITTLSKHCVLQDKKSIIKILSL
jgi:hypothetical protein